MKLIVIGSSRQRRELRAALEDSPPEIVGEFESLADARRSGVPADAFVRAAGDDPGAADDVDDVSPAAEHLTPRELGVLELLAEGLPNKAIAERLGISDQTVKFHIGSIIGKLGAANRTDAVRRGVRRGLVSL
jgi:DNA-binding NarL/FixJ family response regulator